MSFVRYSSVSILLLYSFLPDQIGALIIVFVGEVGLGLGVSSVSIVLGRSSVSTLI